MKRRELFKKLGLLTLASSVGTLFPSRSVFSAPTKPARDIFADLGLRTFINCRGGFVRSSVLGLSAGTPSSPSPPTPAA